MSSPEWTTNLLSETIDSIRHFRYTVRDVYCVATNEGMCSWIDFVQLAQVDYKDPHQSKPLVRQDLKVVFKDGNHLFRWNECGREGWDLWSPAEMRETIKSVFN